MRLTFPLALGLLFLGLKLCKFITWSWWIVLLPFYAPIPIFFILCFFLGIIPAYERCKKEKNRMRIVATFFQKSNSFVSKKDG